MYVSGGNNYNNNSYSTSFWPPPQERQSIKGSITTLFLEALNKFISLGLAAASDNTAINGNFASAFLP